MEQFVNVLNSIDGIVWGIPLIVLIMGTGIFLTVRLKVVQFRKLGTALKFMVKNEEDGAGEVSSFGALCTALAATIGTGNIVGVATAVALGGPGAIFWMICAACFGMATKYSEGLLAVKFRKISPNSHVIGGPFQYIESGMGPKWKWLAVLFAIFGVSAGLLGIGTITQVNGITSAVQNVFDPDNQSIAFSIGSNDYSWATVISAVVVAALVALVIIGGIKRISSVTEVVVPFMAILYFLVCIAILIFNITKVPGAFADICKSAFGFEVVGFKPVAAGMLGALFASMQAGVARGIFSNESGLGSAPIAAAAAQTNEPARQGLISMTGTFIDTIVICNLTGLTIMVTGAVKVDGLEGAQVTAYAFGKGLPWGDSVGSVILMICLAFFAFTTILGWDYYSERCLEYLTGSVGGVHIVYRWLYILAVLIGPFLTIEFVWTLADICNGLMAIPNLIALIALNGVVVAETKKYLEKLKLDRLPDHK